MFFEDDEQLLDQMEKWVENYFLDPLTSMLDYTQFPVDLYETDQEWIVEAQLNDFRSSDTTVFIEDQKLVISASKFDSASKKQRIIEFPFLITNQKVNANFQNGILEVFISKCSNGLKRNRFITLP